MLIVGARWACRAAHRDTQAVRKTDRHPYENDRHSVLLHTRIDRQTDELVMRDVIHTHTSARLV